MADMEINDLEDSTLTSYKATKTCDGAISPLQENVDVHDKVKQIIIARIFEGKGKDPSLPTLSAGRRKAPGTISIVRNRSKMYVGTKPLSVSSKISVNSRGRVNISPPKDKISISPDTTSPKVGRIVSQVNPMIGMKEAKELNAMTSEVEEMCKVPLNVAPFIVRNEVLLSSKTSTTVTPVRYQDKFHEKIPTSNRPKILVSIDLKYIKLDVPFPGVDRDVERTILKKTVLPPLDTNTYTGKIALTNSRSGLKMSFPTNNNNCLKSPTTKEVSTPAPTRDIRCVVKEPWNDNVLEKWCHKRIIPFQTSGRHHPNDENKTDNNLAPFDEPLSLVINVEKSKDAKASQPEGQHVLYIDHNINQGTKDREQSMATLRRDESELLFMDAASVSENNMLNLSLNCKRPKEVRCSSNLNDSALTNHGHFANWLKKPTSTASSNKKPQIWRPYIDNSPPSKKFKDSGIQFQSNQNYGQLHEGLSTEDREQSMATLRRDESKLLFMDAASVNENNILDLSLNCKRPEEVVRCSSNLNDRELTNHGHFANWLKKPTSTASSNTESQIWRPYIDNSPPSKNSKDSGIQFQSNKNYGQLQAGLSTENNVNSIILVENVKQVTVPSLFKRSLIDGYDKCAPGVCFEDNFPTPVTDVQQKHTKTSGEKIQEVLQKGRTRIVEDEQYLKKLHDLHSFCSETPSLKPSTAFPPAQHFNTFEYSSSKGQLMRTSGGSYIVKPETKEPSSHTVYFSYGYMGYPYLKYICVFCSKPLGTDKIEKHYIKHHFGDKPYECPICLARFSDIMAYHNHYTEHLTKNEYFQFTCPQCYKTTAWKWQMKLHFLDAHIVDKKFN